MNEQGNSMEIEVGAKVYRRRDCQIGYVESIESGKARCRWVDISYTTSSGLVVHHEKIISRSTLPLDSVEPFDEEKRFARLRVLRERIGRR